MILCGLIATKKKQQEKGEKEKQTIHAAKARKQQHKRDETALSSVKKHSDSGYF